MYKPVNSMHIARINHAKVAIAQRIKEAAEAEIQKIIGEVGDRIRTAIARDVKVQIGDLHSIVEDATGMLNVNVRIHVSTEPAKRDSQYTPTINVSDPSKLLP